MPNSANVSSPSDLRQLLFERSKAFRNVLPLRHSPDPSLKWRYVSGLQKAIRRGHSEVAAICADALSQIDPGYFWKRLPTIALEDVGFGSKLACALTIEAAKSGQFRRKLGERQVLFYLVSKLSDSTKDRSLCDLLVLNQNRPPTAALWSQYVHSLDLPFIDSYLAIEGRSAANLGVQIPLLISRVTPPVTVVRSAPDPFGDEIIAGLPACTYDMHTWEGKRAYAYFAKACGSVRQFFSTNSELDPVRSIGIVMFISESAILNEHLTWPGRCDLLCSSQERDYAVHGLTRTQAHELQLIAQENRLELNRARRAVVR